MAPPAQILNRTVSGCLYVNIFTWATVANFAWEMNILAGDAYSRNPDWVVASLHAAYREIFDRYTSYDDHNTTVPYPFILLAFPYVTVPVLSTPNVFAGCSRA